MLGLVFLVLALLLAIAVAANVPRTRASTGLGCQSALNSFQVTASKSFHLVSPISSVSYAV